MHWPWRAAMFKTLYRNTGTYKKLGVHRPRSPVADQVDASRWFDGQGRELGAQFRTRRIFSNYGRPNYGLVQLNHYPLGSMESYVLKTDRGRAVHSDHVLGMDYWVERNWCDVEDRSVLQLHGVEEHRRTFANDPQLAELHEKSAQWRKERFETLLSEEPNRALFARLLMTPPARAVSIEAARFLASHAHQSVVNELAPNFPEFITIPPETQTKLIPNPAGHREMRTFGYDARDNYISPRSVRAVARPAFDSLA